MMINIPQLRVRTGYSFREVYGRIPEIFDRLIELKTDIAAIVDSNTWGHVRWEKEAIARGIKPIFGMEVPINNGNEKDFAANIKPTAWILADNLKSFYNATTNCVRQGGLTPKEFGELKDVVRFCGGAIDILTDDQFDFIDLNPASLLLLRKGLNRHRKTQKDIVITGYNSMPDKSQSIYAYAWEVKSAVALRSIENAERYKYEFSGLLREEEYESAVKNTVELGNKLSGRNLNKAPLIHLEGDLVALARKGMEYRINSKHISEWTKEYEERFLEEIYQIQLKDFDSYFLVVADLVQFAKTKMLVGAARGSSAGSLICYCLGITEVDPIPHGLLFQRFIDISREDLPDIDIDFADTKRYLVFEYLQNKYGKDNVVKLGNINTLKSNSVMAQVGKKFDISYNETANIKNALIEYSSGDARYGKGLEDTMATTSVGKSFKLRYPAAADCMGNLEIHPSHTGVHAAGILVCNDNISDYCTVNSEGIAQIDKPDSEYLNLLKIDALGLRTLGIIEDSNVITAEELYSLKLDDPAVLSIIDEDKVSGIFQFEGDAVRSVTRSVSVDKFSKIDNLTALARPGPLASGMAQKYIARASGKEEVTYDVPQLEKYLSETYGVFLYQEQIMAVVKDIGLFDWVKTSAVRKAMSGRKGEEYFNQMGEEFVAGAVSQGIERAQALKIWQEMVTFGSWGFNKSHSVSYAIITYWTCWIKKYYPLEFAAACLRSAKSEDQTIAILRELAKEGVDYVPIDTEHSSMNWTIADGKLIGGIMNAKGYGMIKASKYIAAREQGVLTDKQREALLKSEVLYSDLNETKTLFGRAYKEPWLLGVSSGNPIVEMKTVKDKDNCLVIGKLTKKILADENEAIRIKKRLERGQKGRMEGVPTQFIDLMCRDDSTDSPMRFRIRPNMFEKYGREIAENSSNGSWFLIKAWKIEGIDMFIVKAIKQLNKSVI